MRRTFPVFGPALAFFLLIAAVSANAQSQSITVQVEDKPAVTVTAGDLTQIPRHKVVLNEHGTRIPYEGVLLHDVLARGGAPFGNELRGKALSSYVLATAQDGYQVVYTLTELDPAFVDSEILVADRRDGKPLDEKEGPFRIVVPGEKKPARSLRMLERLQVTQVRK
ncbi:MAG: molybdopterin-dependent oxidoreductase [Acidobacteriaceae bacterium]|nr:molybdopterin-dependent oxidoreductase [Acidobacteriaceae bacterium]MBV9441431.1 molybdopterin-dependent oxidoreductase [Acidobacteriaceae bacterium]